MLLKTSTAPLIFRQAIDLFRQTTHSSSRLLVQQPAEAEAEQVRSILRPYVPNPTGFSALAPYTLAFALMKTFDIKCHPFAGSSFPEIAYFFTRAGVDKYEYGRVSGEEFFEFLMFYEMTPPHNQVIKPDENLILSKIHKVLVTEFATLLNFLKDNHRICAEVFDKTVMLVAKLFVEDLQNAVFRLLSRRLNERLEQYARISSYQPNGPVLSIGCGLNGLIQVEASGRRGNILVDNHPLTAEILRTYIRLKERKDVVVCERDVREFNLGSGSFGLLNSEIFVHMFNVQEIEMILRGLYGAMQINGTFYLKEPTSGCCTSTSQTGETMVKVLQDLFPYVYRRTCEFVKPGDPTQTGDGIEIVGSATRLV